MKVVAFSDSHMQHMLLSVPEGDLLVVGGDFLARGSMKEFIEFSSWLSSLPHPYKVVVPGNHDAVVQQEPKLCADMLKNYGVTLLLDSMVEIEEKKIYGTPWTPTFGRWSFMEDDTAEGLGRRFVGIPEGLDLLISHGPPFGVLDKTKRGESVGSQELLVRIWDANPKMVVCGHIHEEYRKPETDIGKTKIQNISVLDERYVQVRGPVVFNI